MLIATLPPIYREELFHEIMTCLEIGGVRYNTGIVSPFEAEETLSVVKAAASDNGKKLWVDIKGRQLRVTHWAMPDYGKIVINHEVEIDGDAWVCFRNSPKYQLKLAHGNVLYIDPPPKQAVGEGQSLNIIGERVRIKGYLTDSDREYIRAAQRLGIAGLMLSFVEHHDDMHEVVAVYGSHPAPELVLKIESPAGINFLSQFVKTELCFPFPQLMAARDDLFITIGEDKAPILKYLREILKRDTDAIVASRLFTGIEHDGVLALSDITDIEFMKDLGYKHFMLSDEICNSRDRFLKVIAIWKSLDFR
jgi:pyruvate kinase